MEMPSNIELHPNETYIWPWVRAWRICFCWDWHFISYMITWYKLMWILTFTHISYFGVGICPFQIQNFVLQYVTRPQTLAFTIEFRQVDRCRNRAPIFRTQPICNQASCIATIYCTKIEEAHIQCNYYFAWDIDPNHDLFALILGDFILALVENLIWSVTNNSYTLSICITQLISSMNSRVM